MREQEVAALIPCSKSKMKAPAKARKLYTGAFFRKILRFSQEHYSHVYILSAKYGLLDLDQIIEPYELRLDSLPIAQRKEWAKMVRIQMREKKVPKKRVFFTPVEYSRWFRGDNPLLGMSIGQRLQWVNQQLRPKGFDL